MAAANQPAAIVVHGGAGASKAYDNGCRAAAEAGLALLRKNGGALDAAVAAVVVLEDDGRFNAGSGSRLRLDGATIETDASVMDSTGVLGAVAGLRSVRNPVLVARAVASTPHHLLCGEGALRFARYLGHQPFDEVSERQRKQYDEMMERLRHGKGGLPGVDNADFVRFWNYETPSPLRGESSRAAASHSGIEDGCDTVGAVVRDAEGRFAVAASTGGAAPSLLGRVGDTPIVGSGFYAGPKGAVAATGVGEHIMRHMLAREVYQWLADGTPMDKALQRAIDLISRDVDLGIIAVSATEAGSASNREMPTWRLQA